MAKNSSDVTGDQIEKPDKPLQCGLVMPISAMDGCPAEHWAEVKSIVTDAIEGVKSPQFVVRLVSEADDVGVIQKRIVQNLYDADLVVCDVSGKNANVMFELGMRLAFDKATVIIKDDKTDYSFDTSVIEHLAYPRDLRFSRVNSFKAALADKVVATYRAAVDDPAHSTFLKSFGKFQVATLTHNAVPAEQFMLDALKEIQSELVRMRVASSSTSSRSSMNVKQAMLGAAITRYAAEHPGSDWKSLMNSDIFANEIDAMISAPSGL
jgi:hypothetical protein